MYVGDFGRTYISIYYDDDKFPLKNRKRENVIVKGLGGKAGGWSSVCGGRLFSRRAGYFRILFYFFILKFKKVKKKS